MSSLAVGLSLLVATVTPVDVTMTFQMNPRLVTMAPLDSSLPDVTLTTSRSHYGWNAQDLLSYQLCYLTALISEQPF